MGAFAEMTDVLLKIKRKVPPTSWSNKVWLFSAVWYCDSMLIYQHVLSMHCETSLLHIVLHYCSCLFLHDTSNIYIVHSRNMLIKICSHDVQYLMVVVCLGVSCVKLYLSQSVPSLQSLRIPHYCGADQVAWPFRSIGQEGRRTSSFVAWEIKDHENVYDSMSLPWVLNQWMI